MYLEASGSDQVNFFFCGLAVSNDNGMTWAKAPANEYYALVSSAGEWDAQGVANPKPMKLGENMYILGYDGESEIALSNMKLGIAIGFDGKHWTKYSGNPILSGDGQGVGDGNRIENALFLRSDFGQPRMNLLYFGGEASPPTNFKIFVSILEADRPPTTGNPCLTRGTVYQDFASPVGISNDISPLASPCAAASISPYGSINIAAPAYTWKADPVATEYRLIVRDESGTALLDQWYSTGSICTSSNICAVKPTLTLADGSYTWQTQARNSVGYGPPGGRTGFVVQSTIQRAKMLWQNDQTGELRAWFMDGATQVGEVSLTPTVVLPTDWKIDGVGQFDGDGKTHLVWRLLTTGNNGIWFMDGVSQTSIGAMPILETAWQLVATDDFNSDGKTDIVWRSTTGSNRIWYMSHAVVLGTVDLTPVPGQDWDILGAGDFNGDGHPDLVWLYKPTGAIALWYMNDSQQLATALVVSGQTGQPETLGASSAWRVFSVADFNGDGNLDLFWWQAGSGGTGVWLMNGATHTGTVGLRAEPDSHWRPVAYLPGSGR